MRFPFRSIVVLVSLGLPALFSSTKLSAAEDPRLEFFETKIRPLFAERCYECHAAETKRKGGLLLDSRSGWEIGGETGPALVPGDPEASLLMRAVSYEEPDLQMPPKNRLSERQIADLRQWIQDGAFDPREGDAAAIGQPAESIDIEARKAAHWAWHAVKPPELPEVQQKSWPRQSLDSFILAKLEEAGLTPNEEASPQVLLRRLFFDLIGLPPSPDQVRAFMASPTEEAYVASVDELLQSPHFGERWGQHWLDLVRYAETWGHEQDYAIPEAWRYRDYVIRALNGDVPYDDFLVEHIAGDLVEPPRLDPQSRTNQSIQGTGFWHLGEATHSPVDIRDDECTRVSNQIDVFSKAFLGLTVMCARCHDHKFDAISTKDYYALFGYLQSSNYQLADVADPEAQAAAYRALTGIKAEEETAVRQIVGRAYGRARDQGPIDWTARITPESKDPGHPLFPLRMAKEDASFEQARAEILKRWLDEETGTAAAKKAQIVVRTERKGELHLTPIKEAYDPAVHLVVDYASEKNPPWYVNGYRFGHGPSSVGSLMTKKSKSGENLAPSLVVEPAAHADLVSESLSGLMRTKTFEVVGDRLWYRYRGRAKVFLAVDSHRVCQGPLHSQRLRMELKGGQDYRWASHDVSKYIGHRVHVEFTPIEGFSLSGVRFGQDEPLRAFQPNGAIRVAVTRSDVGSWETLNGALNRVFDHAVHGWVQGDALDSETAALVDWILFRSGLLERNHSADLQRTLQGFAKARKISEASIPEPIRALALMEGSPENEPVHVRGNYRTLSRETVPRGTLQALQIPGRDTASRLQLAHAVASADNPLTGRVFVNRVWHHLFGRGIIETVDNFGVTGAPPSHPELLDHLAHRFTRVHDWSIKALLREVVLSNSYRMSSRPDHGKAKVDPANRLWHRMPVRRLTSEVIRDHLLCVSGRLDSKIYGKSVMVHISEFMRNNRSPKGSGPLDGDGRRSIYIEGRRNHMEPLLVAFDKPTPFTAIGRRNVSSSPAQPLMLLNNELVHQEAARWARRILERGGEDDGERLREAYWTAFSREPETWEEEVALAFLAEQRDLYSGGDADLQAWTDLAHTLINVKEFIFIN